MPPTATPTEAPLGNLTIFKVDGSGSPLTHACFEVWLTADFNVFDEMHCDSDDPDLGDGSPNGRIELTDLEPGNYSILEITAPSGYAKDPNVYGQAIVAGQTAEITFINELEANPQGSTVFLIKLNCNYMPEFVNVAEVHAGQMPHDECWTAPAGVTFDVKDPQGVTMYTGIATDGDGSIEIFVPYGTDTIYLYEYNGSNDGVTIPDGADPFVISDVHSCPCKHTNRVIVNVYDS